MRCLLFLSMLFAAFALGCVAEEGRGAREEKTVRYLDCGKLQEAAAGYRPFPAGYLHAPSISITAVSFDELVVGVENHLSGSGINVVVKLMIDYTDFEAKTITVLPGEKTDVVFNLPVSIMDGHEIIAVIEPQKPEDLPAWEAEIDFGQSDINLKNHLFEIEVSYDDWGGWKFSRDSDNLGVEESWHAVSPGGGDWREIKVPSRWADTWVGGDYYGYGWYRVEFNVPGEWKGKPLMLEFGAVDEQAWVYFNGEPAGEHTVESEGLAIGILWNRQFAIEVMPENINYGGKNLLVVRTHASVGAAGIWMPVRGYITYQRGGG